MDLDLVKLRTMISPEISKIELLREIDSTNNYLKQEGKKGAPHGTLVFAERQTAGRGRMNRKFTSPTDGLYMSLLLRPSKAQIEPGLYTIAAAVSVAEAIEKMTKLSTEIKWVNDVLLNQKKVCGILTEGVFINNPSPSQFLVIGIGINANTPFFGEDLTEVATSMRIETDRQYNLNILAIRIINTLLGYIKHLEQREFLLPYRQRLNCIGKQIYPIDHPNDVYIANDIDENGHLITTSSVGACRIFSTGEVSIRIKKQ